MKKQPRYPLVSICVVNYYGKNLLKDCFDSILALNYPPEKIEVIFINNSPADDSISFVTANYPQFKTFNNQVNNFCAANNLAFAHSRGEFIALLNSDALLDKNWLQELIKVGSKDKKAAALGGKVLLIDGKIQSTGHVSYPNGDWGDRGYSEEDNGQYDLVEEVLSISNCAALYRKKAIRKTGFLDEDFNMYMEDVDLNLRLRQRGWKVLYVPGGKVLHKLHGSRQNERGQKFLIERNRLLFLAKHSPDRLPQLFFTDEKKLKYNNAEFQLLLVAVIYKLIKHHGMRRALNTLSQLSSLIPEKADTYVKEWFAYEEKVN